MRAGILTAMKIHVSRSKFLHRVIWYVSTYVSEACTASVSRMHLVLPTNSYPPTTLRKFTIKQTKIWTEEVRFNFKYQLVIIKY